MGPLAWILIAAGQDRSARLFQSVRDGASVNSHDFVGPAIVLAAAGLLLGLIATLRFSPLGPVLLGLAYAGSYLGLLVDPQRTVDLLDHKPTLAGHQIDLAAPVQSGMTLVLGALLLVAVVSTGRWRRWPRPDGEPEQEDSFSLPSTRDRTTTVSDSVGAPTQADAPTAATAGAGRSEWLDSMRNGPRDTSWQAPPWGPGQAR